MNIESSSVVSNTRVSSSGKFEDEPSGREICRTSAIRRNPNSQLKKIGLSLVLCDCNHPKEKSEGVRLFYRPTSGGLSIRPRVYLVSHSQSVFSRLSRFFPHSSHLSSNSDQIRRKNSQVTPIQRGISIRIIHIRQNR